MSTASTPRGAPTTDRSPGQYLALAIGAVYTLVGIAGFFVTGFDGFASPDGELLLGFEVNPLHNIVHLVIGVLGLAMWSTRANARMYGWILAVGYGAAAVYGFIVGGTDDAANFLAINAADNVLHIVSALLGVAVVALAQPRGTVAARGGQPAAGAS